jgi:transcriptional regulator with XRE-family HTH domain
MANEAENFGDVLKALRLRSGLSQAELAAAVYHSEDVDARRQRIGRIERESWVPPDSEIAKIANALSSRLDMDVREVRGLLFSQKDDREDALLHIRALQTAVEVLLALVDNNSSEVVKELQATVNVLLRLSGLVPESFFWDAILRYINFQGVGSQFMSAQHLLPLSQLLTPEEKTAFDEAVSYFSVLQNRGVNITMLPKDFVPVDMMRMWVNVLRDGDRLTATHYASVEASWSQDAWKAYHRANLQAAMRGVKIERFFIYDKPHELKDMDQYMREQARAGIKVRSVPSDALGNTVLDIAVVMDKILGILTLKANEPRTPVSIDFVHLQKQQAQAGLVRSYNDLLLERSEDYDDKSISPVGTGKVK